MSLPKVAYRAFLAAKGSDEVTSLIAYTAPLREPLKAVMWHAARKEWIFAPGLAARPLFDETYPDESIEVDRTAAERVAREQLQTELPSVERIAEMYEEGERMGWRYGPPQT